MAKAVQHHLTPGIMRMPSLRSHNLDPDEIADRILRRFRQHLEEIGFDRKQVNEAIELADLQAFDWTGGKVPAEPARIPGAPGGSTLRALTSPSAFSVWCRQAGVPRRHRSGIDQSCSAIRDGFRPGDLI